MTLAQSVLCSIHSYTMQSVLLPKETCDDLDKIIRCFILKDSKEHRRVHLVGWHSICSPKDIGSWGLWSMSLQNSAFMCKLAWIFQTKPDLPWVKLLQ